ncbi:MAG: bifunctional oligoribonuclease/PAP phosphatase NrnA [Phycisphaerales bacterium]|nr:MAG: bifunctional oligoribonuclease/PAP phosphatase NrnA [Phycisphaerales bacterium]
MSDSDSLRIPYAVPSAVVETLRAAKHLVVAGHVTPDADCLGSILGTARVLQAGLGCRAEPAVAGGDVPRRLRFMIEMAGMPVVTGAVGPAADTALILDTAKSSRVNVPGDWAGIQAPGRKLVNIDHHASNQGYAPVNWVVGTASSTSEIVYWLIQEMGLPIDVTTASLLYCGIWGDTAGFSLPNTGGSALQAAAGLVAVGVDVEYIGQHMCRSIAPGEFQLQRIVYDNTRVVAGSRIAYSTIDHEELSSTGCTAVDIDDQVEIPRRLDGSYIAMLFSEGHRGKIRINLRGERGTNVLPLAQRLGGGGHDKAAGAIIDGTIPDVVARVLAEAEAYLDQLSVGT